MGLAPPTQGPFDRVGPATKDDLADLEQRLRLEMKALEERFRAELHKGLRSQLVVFVAVMTLLNTGLFTAFRLTL